MADEMDDKAAYGDNVTIKDVISRIGSDEYVLPPIQRMFVWDMEQIEKLFDSLLRGYPISTFLFWKVDGKNIDDLSFYKFVREYHEDKDENVNRHADSKSHESVIAILDGQQRMTSLYLGLKGSYSERRRRGKKGNFAEDYPKRKLYLNLSKLPSDDVEDDYVETKYEFKFLSDEEVKSDKESFWFECRKILEFEKEKDVMDYLLNNNLTSMPLYSKEVANFHSDTLFTFFEVVHKRATIRYYLEKSKNLDEVLQIFIRTNSAGTELSHSDLLFSVVTEKWAGKDAREVITKFVNEINNIGGDFNFGFSKDVVLKACLVLCGGDVKFKAGNFGNKTMAKMGKNWEKISEAIRIAVSLVKSWGYSDKSLIAKNAIIPIAYYLYKNDLDRNKLFSSKYRDNISLMKQWLARSLLRGTFGSATDSVYPPLRELIDAGQGKFPLQEIINHYEHKSKSISFGPNEINDLLDLKYGKKKTFALLTLLYSDLDRERIYHQDHIHPKDSFKANKNDIFAVGNALEGKHGEFLKRKDKIPNLQLLSNVGNSEKFDKSLQKWVNEVYKNKENRESFLRENYIDLEQSLEFENFLNFYEARRQRIKDELMRVLGVKPDSKEDEAA